MNSTIALISGLGLGLGLETSGLGLGLEALNWPWPALAFRLLALALKLPAPLTSLIPDRNAFRKLNLMGIRYSKEAWYFSRPAFPNPKGSAFDNQRYDRIYRLSFHFLSYFTVEIKRPIKYG